MSLLSAYPAMGNLDGTEKLAGLQDGHVRLMDPRHAGPWANVVAFGADPTGVKDSTAAFLAAEASFTGTYGGVVFMPPGVYKVGTDGTGKMIAFQKPGTSLIGSGGHLAINALTGSQMTAPTVIDASGFNYATSPYYYNQVAPVITSEAGGSGAHYANFGILMPLRPNVVGYWFSQHGGVAGLWPNGSDVVIQNVCCHNGDIGFYLFDAINVTLVGCKADFANSIGIACVRGCEGVYSFGSLYQNAALNVAPFSFAAADIFVGSLNNQDGPHPLDCHFYGFTDEGGNADGANVWLADGSDCGYHNGRINTISNAAVVRIGGGLFTANRMIIDNVWIGPYGSETNSPSATIKIESTASNTILRDVTTVPQTGTDIVDSGTGTVWSNVNGKYKYPSLPAADPHVVGELWNNAGVLTVSAG